MTRLLTLALLAFLQVWPVNAQPKGDVCHVYVIDVDEAKKAIERFKPSGDREKDAQILQAGITVFPDFETRILEEVFTTKHFRLPRSNRIITASIFYTDESMVSRMGEKGELNPESMIAGIAVTGQEEDAIFELADNAITEVTMNNTLSKVRVKKYLSVGKKLFLVGLECDCNAKREKVKR